MAPACPWWPGIERRWAPCRSCPAMSCEDRAIVFFNRTSQNTQVSLTVCVLFRTDCTQLSLKVKDTFLILSRLAHNSIFITTLYSKIIVKITDLFCLNILIN